MNRQAITFLTLFSLILVLSIYYILLPPEGEASEVSVNNEELSQIEVLQQNLEKERADLISENNAIIASSDSDSNKIAAALANISEAKETAALEAKITKIINDAGFKNAFVEVENKTIKVVIDKRKQVVVMLTVLLKQLWKRLKMSIKLKSSLSVRLEFYLKFIYNGSI